MNLAMKWAHFFQFLFCSFFSTLLSVLVYTHLFLLIFQHFTLITKQYVSHWTIFAIRAVFNLYSSRQCFMNIFFARYFSDLNAVLQNGKKCITLYFLLYKQIWKKNLSIMQQKIISCVMLYSYNCVKQKVKNNTRNCGFAQSCIYLI